jgi:TPR repeat protein
MGQMTSFVSVANEGARLSSLGKALLFGEGVERDRRRARQVLEQASLFGSAEGTYFLAYVLTRGYGGPKDEVRAKELLEMAGKRGYPLSATPQDQEAAFMCFDEQAGVHGKEAVVVRFAAVLLQGDQQKEARDFRSSLAP